MSTSIDIPGESKAEEKGKAPLMEGASSSSNEDDEKKPGGLKKWIAIFDFVLRLCAVIAALAAAATMGTSDQTLPFFTRFFQFQASYDDLPTFQFFVIAMAIVAGYLVLSLPLSVVGIMRPHVVAPRLLLLILDTVVMTLNTAAAAAAAAIVYLAHTGNPNANWFAICNQFGDFCGKVSAAVVASFVSAVVFILMVAISALALRM